MKNSNFKKILSTMLFAALVLATVFAISSCNKTPKEEHVHQLTEHVVDPTCTENGAKTVTCADPSCNYEEIETIPAFGHTEGRAVEENRAEPATCTEDGSFDTVVYCVVCGDELDRTTSVIEAPGHSWDTVPAKAATCQVGWYEHEECTECHAKQDYVEIPAAYDHLASDYPIELSGTRVAATCTEDGHYNEAVVCMHNECGAIIGEINVVILPALGHDLVKHEAKAPTCTEIGYEAYEDCQRCDYTTYVKISALGHTESEVQIENLVSPTCGEKGSLDEVVYCTVCDAELSRKPKTIEKLPHAEENKTQVDAKANSCTEIGWDAYWTCGDCGYSTYVEIPANGHTKSDVVVRNIVEPTCSEAGSYDRVIYCTVCEIVLDCESWTVDPVSHNIVTIPAKDVTCTEDGYSEHLRCSKCGYTEGKEVIPALGHEITKHEAKAATCEGIGWDAWEECANCDYSTYVEIGALGHDVVTLDAVAPTCTETGLTAGQYCTRCDELDVAQQIVDALGHDRDANGLCTVCGNKISAGLTVENGVLTGLGSCTDKNVVIPDGVVAIADNAFKRSNVESVVIPDSVKSIGSETFFSCTSLKSVVIGAGVESIGENAFFGCSRLESVTIGADVKSVGDGAFDSCYKLSTVYYCGTASEWNAIAIGSDNDKLTSATRYYI